MTAAATHDELDRQSIAYRTGVIDQHFGRPAHSDDRWYLAGYQDPDPYMPPQYAKPGRTSTSPWPLQLKRKGRAR